MLPFLRVGETAWHEQAEKMGLGLFDLHHFTLALEADIYETIIIDNEIS